MKERQLLEELVEMLSVYNGPDMLEGYLNQLGDQFNNRLGELGLSLIKKQKEE